jgi:hypothetical protein
MHHVVEGLRPEFHPGCLTAYVELAQRCWDADPDARPTFNEVGVAGRGGQLKQMGQAGGPCILRPDSERELRLMQARPQSRTRALS